MTSYERLFWAMIKILNLFAITLRRTYIISLCVVTSAIVSVYDVIQSCSRTLQHRSPSDYYILFGYQINTHSAREHSNHTISCLNKKKPHVGNNIVCGLLRLIHFHTYEYVHMQRNRLVFNQLIALIYFFAEPGTNFHPRMTVCYRRPSGIHMRMTVIAGLWKTTFDIENWRD